MRPLGLLLIALTLVLPGCGATTTTIGPPPAGDSGSVDISGKWSGTWRGHVMGISRADDATADLVQQGSRGAGRLVLHTTGVAESVPVALRNAGLTGVRVVFEASGNEVVMRHEFGARHFRADFKVAGDRLVGLIRNADPPIRIVLARDTPSMPAAASPAPAAAPAPQVVAAAPAPTPMPAEPGRPTPSEFQAIPEVQPIYFDFDKYDVRPDDAKILEANAEWLKTNAEARVLIEGHCDQRGTAEYNLALGERRAHAARDHLVSSGVAADRITTVSLGAEQPTCTEANEACWSKNRRANFLVKPR